ncbi:MAG: GNAT family N-acetyltransferase [Pyrinomonadaceae bacterium]
MIILETERLRLRRLSPDIDAEFIIELLNDPSFLRYIGDKGVRDLEAARRYITDGPARSYDVNGFGLYLVELKTNETAIGICGLVKRDTLAHADIGFAFLPAYWNQGYAFESAAAVTDHARAVLGLNRILAITTPENESSAKLLDKIGFQFAGLVRLAEGAPEVRLFESEAKST